MEIPEASLPPVLSGMSDRLGAFKSAASSPVDFLSKSDAVGGVLGSAQSSLGPGVSKLGKLAKPVEKYLGNSELAGKLRMSQDLLENGLGTGNPLMDGLAKATEAMDQLPGALGAINQLATSGAEMQQAMGCLNLDIPQFGGLLEGKWDIVGKLNGGFLDGVGDKISGWMDNMPSLPDIDLGIDLDMDIDWDFFELDQSQIDALRRYFDKAKAIYARIKGALDVSSEAKEQLAQAKKFMEKLRPLADKLNKVQASVASALGCADEILESLGPAAKVLAKYNPEMASSMEVVNGLKKDALMEAHLGGIDITRSDVAKQVINSKTGDIFKQAKLQVAEASGIFAGLDEASSDMIASAERITASLDAAIPVPDDENPDPAKPPITQEMRDAAWSRWNFEEGEIASTLSRLRPKIIEGVATEGEKKAFRIASAMTLNGYTAALYEGYSGAFVEKHSMLEVVFRAQSQGVALTEQDVFWANPHISSRMETPYVLAIPHSSLEPSVGS